MSVSELSSYRDLTVHICEKKHDTCHAALLLRMAKDTAALDSLLKDKYQLYHSLLHGLRSGPEV